MAVPVTPVNQQNAANPITPTPGLQNLTQEIEQDDHSSESSDDMEII
jgi:hypothetical protein